MFVISPKPVEWQHHKRCLAYAVLCVVENLRDSNVNTFEFKLAVAGGVVAPAEEYLADGLVDCQCPEDWAGVA